MWITFCLLGALIAYLSTNKRYRWIYIVIMTLPRDLLGLYFLVRLAILTRKCTKQNYTIPKVFSTLLKEHPNKVAFYFEDQTWTYTQVDEFSNKIAEYFIKNGYKKGDTIALFLENCVEYPCIWLGLLKIGIKAAMQENIIFGSSLAHAIDDISSNLSSMKLHQLRENGIENTIPILKGCFDLRNELYSVPSEAIDYKYFEAKSDDPAIYIFTSGTTGLPKAALVSHLRCILIAKSVSLLGVTNCKDIFYTPLPLYHTAGGLLGVGQALVSGITVVIRRRFSATQYFKDCEKYNATVAQYVGELCRYILATPDNGPIHHRVKMIIGNGLKPQIWKQFTQRFGIKKVVEVYGATEGISNMGNIDNKEGAVGFIPRYLKHVFPLTLIKCDEATGEPIKNNEGRCIECGVEEPGLLIGKISRNIPALKFDGYTDRKSSEKKIFYNVFREGDAYFNSGDILMYDELGYIYFKDRTGDTFRWKGENVSTSEVEAIISNIVQLNDVIVYGVSIPGCEGNAGMAAIVDTDRSLNISSIIDAFRKNLPSYAIPLFIRILDSVPITGTFKLKKTQLRDDGYNISKINGAVYLLHPKQKTYIALTADAYRDILDEKIRL